MSLRNLFQFKWRWWSLFFLGGMTKVLAQSQAGEEGLRWMRLRMTEASVGVEAEGDWEKRSVQGTDQKSFNKSIYAVPTLGLGLEGSIYHPNLLEYKLDGEGGVGWQHESQDLPGGGSRTDPLYLLRYHANVAILKEKPYTISLFADNEHNTRTYDFFTRATVDQASQGVRLGYTEGPVPFSVTFRHLREDISGNDRPTQLDENTLTFMAYHEQSEGNRTDLSYTFNDFYREEFDSYTQDGTYHLASLNDVKTFGEKDQLRLGSSLNYNHQDNTTTPYNRNSSTRQNTKIFSDNEHLRWKHSRQLTSDYKYSFNRQESGSVDSDAHASSAALQHQLYESLTSTVDIHHQYYSSQGSDSSIESSRYGFGLNENYTKKMRNWGRVTFGYGGLFDHEDRETTGQLIIVTGEVHSLSDASVTFLNQPRVHLSTIQVWDNAGGILYRELLDYLVVPHGERTEIRRVVGGQIPNGSQVRVDYTATAQPSDSFNVVSHQLHLRFDFFNGLLGVYGYLNFQDHQGGESLILEDIEDKIVGMDLSWRWFRTGGEYQVYDSNLSPYRTLRLFQNVTVEATEDTTVSLDVGQSWTTYTMTESDLTIYHFIARTRTRLLPNLSLNLEGGVRIQQGQGYDQQLATARADLEYRYGKLTVQAGYLYEDEDYLQEERLRNFFYLRAKRNF